MRHVNCKRNATNYIHYILGYNFLLMVVLEVTCICVTTVIYLTSPSF